jgi:hypothetical protein
MTKPSDSRRDEGPSLHNLPKTPGGTPIGANKLPKPNSVYTPPSKVAPEPAAPASSAAALPQTPANAQPQPKCLLCGAAMLPGKGKPSSSTTGVGCITMLIGGLLCVFGGPVGILIGALLILYGAIRGSARQKGLRCTACKHFIPIS